MKKVYILLIILVVVGLGGIYILREEADSPQSNKRENVLFEVKRGNGLFTIASNLEKEGLIKNKYVFIFYILSKNYQKNLKAGSYYLNPAMTPQKIARTLLEGETADIKITIPEGFNLRQIEERINKNMNTDYSLSAEKAGEYKNSFPFLLKVPSQHTLEGFLFPDTYFFHPEVPQEEMAGTMLATFQEKALPPLKQSEKGMFETLVMASLLEKEVTTLEEKKIVAGILWKRIRIGMPLQVDATITYITGKKSVNVSREETNIDSPYNTYKYKGLPIGPICSPGLESIEAALNPEESDYWYYLSTKEGETIFSESLAEHNINKAKYLR